MWNGLVTEELLSLFRQYAQQNYGVEPDDYEDIDYDDITYDEFVSFIRECLATGKEIPDVVDWPPLPMAPVVFLFRHICNGMDFAAAKLPENTRKSRSRGVGAVRPNILQQ